MADVLSLPQLSDATLSMLGLSVVICVLAPIVAVVVALFKIKKTVMPLLFGIVLYFFAQMLLVSPIGSLFLMATGLGDAYTTGATHVAFLLSFLIAIIEEAARFVCLAYLMKSYRRREDAIMFGLGYGAINMLISGGLTSFNDLITATALNSGAVAELDAVTQQSFAQAGAAMAELPPIAYLMTSVDQCCLAIMSIALAILLMEGIRTKNNRMLVVTMTVRVMAQCGPILLNSLWKWGFLTASLFLVGIAGVSIWYMVKTKKSDPSKPNFRTI